MKPVIGITAYVEQARWGVWDQRAVLIPHDYVRMLEAAGGRALVVPPSEDAVEETLDALDGIVFSGGADLDPALYGADAHDATDAPRVDRDAGELALLTRRARAGPADAGSLPRQPAPERRPRRATSSSTCRRRSETRGTRRCPGPSPTTASRFARERGWRSWSASATPVKSHHHQGFGRVGDGLVETAWADDGTLEGLEDPSRRFALGVLWHPEAGEDVALFVALVEEARRYRDERLGVAGRTVS